MKKLKLGVKDVQDILTRDEMKLILGGNGSDDGSEDDDWGSMDEPGSNDGTGDCAFYMPPNWQATSPGHSLDFNSSGASTVDSTTMEMTIRGVNRESAELNSAIPGGKWCCDSCGDASWY